MALAFGDYVCEIEQAGYKVKNANLDKMSLSELKQFRKDVDRAIESFHERRKAEAASELEAIARQKGYSLAELTAMTRKKRKPVRQKYRHPEDPKITWSGRGHKPKWVVAALNEGKTLDDLKI